ncbi:Ni/Co efflux regulator RcnB [Sphingobium fontiphilum]|uniref:Ni/Co efflux regulator RcnB n=1 Tax=Sphingobium fontiphilum TaxID=944425 RepID=A0A7W6GMF4_9SPHN|nr:RcnB family protein [Sphingobium fontiphilum]MBB3980417.1 Ni/Co efflux regulator RcnB [Sphingobium fontiphilum]
MFKKILIALTATTMIAGPIATTQAQAATHGPQKHRTETTRIVVKHKPLGRTIVKQKTVRKAEHRRWAKGQRFDRRHAANYRVVNNYRNYRLSAPPRGYHWVRSGNDAALIAITGGVIGAVIGGAFR